ncbi:hypothetical protein [Tuwongella immobilis]|uniref:Uncharacterized protein n=1 Tax=Tuwongella immobilis TaxID=692036 RepID=A0A6C2YXV8_9BACT|nr:hypothetical protein [Tuwongella immobilis]VIP05595.1 unnamed protein product [Tuwongella immobilis]VTS08545.1 unnamed protein product [Tuwongella immobilis]
MSEEFSGRIILSTGPASRIATKAPLSADGEPLWATDTKTLYVCQGGKAIQISSSGGLATVAVASAGGLSGDGDTAPLRINSTNMPDNPEPDAAAYLAILGGDGADVERCKIGNMLESAVSGDVTITDTGAASVVAIRGVSVAATAPSTNQVLTYNGTVWTPAALPASPPPPPAVDVGNIPGPLRIGATETVSFSTNTTITLGSTTTHLRLNNTAGALRNLLGITGGSQGRVLYVTNVGADVDVIHVSTSATAGNRLLSWSGTSNTAFVRLAFGETMTLVYQTNWSGTGVDVWEAVAVTPFSIPNARVVGLGALALRNTFIGNDNSTVKTLSVANQDLTTTNWTDASGLITDTLPAGLYDITLNLRFNINYPSGGFITARLMDDLGNVVQESSADAIRFVANSNQNGVSLQSTTSVSWQVAPSANRTYKVQLQTSVAHTSGPPAVTARISSGTIGRTTLLTRRVA